jgi:acyl dehydratase
MSAVGDQTPAQSEVDAPLVDPGALAALRAKIGQRVTVNSAPYLTEVTADAARHWADALGDRNPLWRDADYARRWGHTDTLAPPTMLYAFDKLSIGYRGGLPGVHSFFAGTNWTWKGPLVRGTAIDVEVVFKDLIEHRSTFAEVIYQQISDIRYRARDGGVLAEAEAWGMRVSRRAAREGKRYSTFEVTSYSPEDIDAVAQEYAAEEVRRTPRPANSVAVGTELPSIVRGPYTVTTAVAFEQAWGGLFIRAHGDWYDYIRRHPAAGLPNAHGIPEPPEAVHWDRDFARRAGLPEAYDYGPERVGWLGVLLTNWMGPTGFLRRLDVQVRRFNMVGDLTHCRGTVVVKGAPEDGRCPVTIEVAAQNQRGERTAVGQAEVLLPVDEAGPAQQ